MARFSKILCVIDPEAQVHPALSRARWLARHNGAALNLFTCCYNEYLSGDRFFDAPSLEKARHELIAGHKSRLEDLASPLRDEGLNVTTDAVWDHPLYEGIVRHAASTHANVIIKDTHHQAAVASALFGNADWSLIRTCPMPLWLAKPYPAGNRQPELKRRPEGNKPLKGIKPLEGIKRVVIAAIDPLNEHDKPAALDDEILALSKMIAETTHAELHVFHAYDPGIALATAAANAYVPISLPCAQIEAQECELHRERFDEIVTYHKIDPSNAHLVAGLTHVELPKLVEKLDAALVVMGAVARNPLKRLFIGATAERTLDQLACDLLIAKPDWFTTPVRKAAPNR